MTGCSCLAVFAQRLASFEQRSHPAATAVRDQMGAVVAEEFARHDLPLDDHAARVVLLFLTMIPEDDVTAFMLQVGCLFARHVDQ